MVVQESQEPEDEASNQAQPVGETAGCFKESSTDTADMRQSYRLPRDYSWVETFIINPVNGQQADTSTLTIDDDLSTSLISEKLARTLSLDKINDHMTSRMRASWCDSILDTRVVTKALWTVPTLPRLVASYFFVLEGLNVDVVLGRDAISAAGLAKDKLVFPSDEKPKKILGSSFSVVDGSKRRVFFRRGVVLRILLTQPAADGVEGESARDIYGIRGWAENVHAKKTWVVIVQRFTKHCTVVPVITYSESESTKSDPYSNDYASLVIEGEGNTNIATQGLSREPFHLIFEAQALHMKLRARIHFAKAYSLEYNSKVEKVGRIVNGEHGRLLEYFIDSQTKTLEVNQSSDAALGNRNVSRQSSIASSDSELAALRATIRELSPEASDILTTRLDRHQLLMLNKLIEKLVSRRLPSDASQSAVSSKAVTANQKVDAPGAMTRHQGSYQLPSNQEIPRHAKITRSTVQRPSHPGQEGKQSFSSESRVPTALFPRGNLTEDTYSLPWERDPRVRPHRGGVPIDDFSRFDRSGGPFQTADGEPASLTDVHDTLERVVNDPALRGVPATRDLPTRDSTSDHGGRQSPIDSYQARTRLQPSTTPISPQPPAVTYTATPAPDRGPVSPHQQAATRDHTRPGALRHQGKQLAPVDNERHRDLSAVGQREPPIALADPLTTSRAPTIKGPRAGPDFEALDARYERRDPSRAGKFFRVGRVFAILSHSEYEYGNEETSAKWVTRKADIIIYSHVRRFAVVREGHGFCWALPLNTYNGRGVSKAGLNEADVQAHAIVYDSRSQPRGLAGEPKLSKRPIAVDRSDIAEPLHAATRISFDKVTSIEHNVRAMAIGRVAESSMRDFSAYWRQHLLG